MDWHHRALCRRFPFLPWATEGSRREVGHALEVCRVCKVRGACLDAAMIEPQPPKGTPGVRAGHMYYELRRIRRRLAS